MACSGLARRACGAPQCRGAGGHRRLQAAFPTRPTAPQRGTFAPQLRPRAAIAETPAEERDLEIAKLTDDIVAAEARLAALFEPGKPMPRAGVVAGMRQELSESKARLAALMAAAGGDSGVALAPPPGPSASDEELAEHARLAFLEVERLLGAKTGSPATQREDSVVIAVMEAENERLRLEATALLLRQQQLEELLDRVRAGQAGGGATR